MEKAEMEQDNLRKMGQMVQLAQAAVVAEAAPLAVMAVTLGLELLEVPALC